MQVKINRPVISARFLTAACNGNTLAISDSALQYSGIYLKRTTLLCAIPIFLLCAIPIVRADYSHGPSYSTSYPISFCTHSLHVHMSHTSAVLKFEIEQCEDTTRQLPRRSGHTANCSSSSTVQTGEHINVKCLERHKECVKWTMGVTRQSLGSTNTTHDTDAKQPQIPGQI